MAGRPRPGRAQLVCAGTGLAGGVFGVFLFGRPLVFRASMAGQAWYGAAPRAVLVPSILGMVGWSVAIVALGWCAHRSCLSILRVGTGEADGRRQGAEPPAPTG
jgi:hypothetical protein